MTFVAEFRHRLFVLAMWLMAWLGLTLGGMVHAYVSPPMFHSVEHRCAHKLGVSYTVEDGTTESLDAFTQCVKKGGHT